MNIDTEKIYNELISIKECLITIKNNNEHRDYRIGELESGLRNITKDVKALQESQTKRNALVSHITKLGGVLTIAIVCLTYYSSEKDKLAQEREQYALTVASPEQERENNALQKTIDKLREELNNKVKNI